MSESQQLVKPYFVRYHTDSEEEGVDLAFPMLVIHEDKQEGSDSEEKTELSGWVFSNDERNTAGLSNGANFKGKVGRGGPGVPGSWSDFEEGA